MCCGPQVIWSLFKLCPTPAAAVVADPQQVSAITDCLGFYKRAAAFQRFSHDYLEKQVRFSDLALDLRPQAV